MKKAVLFFVTLFLFNCTPENEIESNDNLISNSSFESGGQFNFQNWIGVQTSSSTDTTHNEGFSLQIEPALYQLEPPHEGFAETNINGLEGAVLLHFYCDTKINNSTSGISGKIIILKENLNGVRTEIASNIFNNTVWQNIDFLINGNFQNTDKLIIHLSAGANEMSGLGEILFDNVVVTIN